MDNRKKRKIYLIISIITGCIFGCGILGFLYIWYNRFQGNNSLTAFADYMPIFLVAIICGGIFQFCYNQYKKLNTGIQGEEKSQNVLSKLPSSYQILSNIPISHEGQKGEIDNLILSSRGIVIVESKNYGGNISGNEQDREWTQNKRSHQGNVYTNTIKNPVKQVSRQVYILSQILKENGIRCWIDGYVFMAGGQCNTDSNKVFTDERHLLQTIMTSGKDEALDEDVIKRIQQILKK
ncbi:MAG: nuclease-related domain-containing protein [Massilimicrobiota timonensis]